MSLLEGISLDSIKPALRSPLPAHSEKWESKAEWATAEAKALVFESGKEERLATYSTLFASFRTA